MLSVIAKRDVATSACGEESLHVRALTKGAKGSAKLHKTRDLAITITMSRVGIKTDQAKKRTTCNLAGSGSEPMMTAHVIVVEM